MPGIRTIPSQANYLMVELDERIPSKELLKRLLVNHNILIKELAGKTNGKNYLRLAIRNSEENDILVMALKKEIEMYR